MTGVSANINSGAPAFLGNARKGGYTTVAKEKAEADKKFAQSLGHDEERYNAVETAGKATIATQERELEEAEKRKETETEAHRMDQERNVKDRKDAEKKVEKAVEDADKAKEAEREANAKATEAETKLEEANEKVRAEADALSKSPDLIKDPSKLEAAKRELATAQAADTLAKSNLATAQAASTAAKSTLDTEKATLTVIKDKIEAKTEEIKLLEKAHEKDILDKKALLAQTKINLNADLNGGTKTDVNGNKVEVVGIKRERQVAYADSVQNSVIAPWLYNKRDIEKNAKAIRDSAGKAPDQFDGLAAELKKLQDQMKANAAKP